MNQKDFISFWQEVHTIVDDAMEKRDRSVSIYISPDNGMSVNVYPWPNPEDLYEMYKDGKISLNDFREKCGLPKIEENGDDGSDCPWGDKYLERAR